MQMQAAFSPAMRLHLIIIKHEASMFFVFQEVSPSGTGSKQSPAPRRPEVPPPVNTHTCSISTQQEQQQQQQQSIPPPPTEAVAPGTGSVTFQEPLESKQITIVLSSSWFLHSFNFTLLDFANYLLICHQYVIEWRLS